MSTPYFPTLRVANHEEGMARLREIREATAKIESLVFPEPVAPEPDEPSDETSTEREITSRADSPAQTDPPTMPGETTGETRGLPKSLAGQASGLSSEDETAVAEAPLCQVGARIHDRHTLGINGRCERCGWEFPRVTKL